MFLLRCLFWLGLVFSQIAQLEGSSAASLAGQTAGAVGAQAGAFGQMAAQAIEKQCHGNSGQCLAQAALAAQAVQTAVAAKGDGAGHDSLTSADRAPAWRETRASEKRP